MKLVSKDDFIEVTSHEIALTEKVAKELQKFLSLDFRRETFQDHFIRPLTFGLVYYTNISLEDNICPSHQNSNGDPTYCAKYFRDNKITAKDIPSRAYEYGEVFHFSREKGAQDRWLSSLICEAAQTNSKFQENPTNPSNDTKITLPEQFDLTDNEYFFRVFKQCGSKHFLPHLSSKDLLSLSASCKFMNNFVNYNILPGLAVRIVRNYIRIIFNSNNRISNSIILTDVLLLINKILAQCIDISTKSFTAYAKRVQQTEELETKMQIAVAYDCGDATVVDNPEANKECNVTLENRKLFLIKINDVYFNVALILSKHYLNFRHANWEGRNEQIYSVKAKEIQPRSLKATIKIRRVLSFNVKSIRRGNLSKSDGKTITPEKLILVKLLDNMGFSRERPDKHELPLNDWPEIPLSFEELVLFMGSKEKVIEELKDIITEEQYNFCYNDYDNFLSFNKINETGEVLMKIIGPYISELAKIAYSNGGKTFMDLWQYPFTPYRTDNANLPLHNIRFPPKEWPNDPNFLFNFQFNSSSEIKDVVKSGWYTLFTHRDTINKGLIVFEN